MCAHNRGLASGEHAVKNCCSLSLQYSGRDEADPHDGLIVLFLQGDEAETPTVRANGPQHMMCWQAQLFEHQARYVSAVIQGRGESLPSQEEMERELEMVVANARQRQLDEV